MVWDTSGLEGPLPDPLDGVVILFAAPGGRTGNLLFQLAYIESIRKPGERVLCTQLKGIHRQFLSAGRRYHNSDHPLLIKVLDKFFVPWFGPFLAFTRLGTVVWERQGEFRISSGLLPLTWIDGYFQGPPARDPGFRIPESAAQKAQEILAGCPLGFVPLFVHVRRTDYEGYVLENGIRPLLAESYYRNAVVAWQTLHPKLKPWLLFVGDSPEWCQAYLADLGPGLVLRNSPLVDLAVMAGCSGGVVSNSTFAWWGFWFLKRRCGGMVIGPRYWLGWPVRRWLPTRLEHCDIRFIDVPMPASPGVAT